MKLIIAGSRTLSVLDSYFAAQKYFTMVQPDYPMYAPKEIYFKGKLVTEFVSGLCPSGPDQLPFMLNDTVGSRTTIKKFRADWNKYGRSAGPRRNQEMAKYADELLLIWDGRSRGSKNMKEEMESQFKPITEIRI